MKNKNAYNMKTFLFVIVSILLATSFTTWVDANDSGIKSLVLRTIMQELNKNMQTVTDAISRGDWNQVVKTAPLIADHPQPPLAEKVHILSFAGFDASKFKNFDKQTHQAAKELEEVSMKQDGKGAIAKFATLQNSCLTCHQSFKKAFKEHFYEK